MKILFVGQKDNHKGFLNDYMSDLLLHGLRENYGKDVVDYMASADLIIGPSSGPIHLASLCGLKHLAWGVENNINRYKYDWNPHNTEMEYIVSENWDPSIKDVKDKMESLL